MHSGSPFYHFPSKQAMLLAVMTVLFVALLVPGLLAESRGDPRLQALGVDAQACSMASARGCAITDGHSEPPLVLTVPKALLGVWATLVWSASASPF